MKNLLILFSLFMLTLTVGFAQPGQGQRGDRGSHREKIKEWRTAFITDKLDLTEEESIRFWPIFNQREKALREISRQKRALRSGIDEMSEEDAEILIDKHFELRQKELNVHKECFENLRKVVPAKKLVQLPRVEREFKKVILDKMRDRRPPGGRQDDGGPF